MIAILSYPGDQVTNEVMDWLHFYKCKYKRINLEQEDFRKLSISLSGNDMRIQLDLADGEVLRLEEVSFFFFRGGLLKLNLNGYTHQDLPAILIKTHLLYEFHTLVGFFYKQVAKKSLGSPLHHPLNKLKQLEFAKKAGLKVPLTTVTSYKKRLNESHLNSQEVLITKSIQENVLYQKSRDLHYDLKVNEIRKEAIDDFFFPSLFQESIKKSAEIRSFYLDGHFYSISMLLCSSDERVIDYRTKNNQMRYARYRLPPSLERKLRQFMKYIGLNTGSIDLIRTDTGAYYFLEVNPHGQIGWVSDFGNYCLEEKIARYLLKKEIQFIHDQTSAIAN